MPSDITTQTSFIQNLLENDFVRWLIFIGIPLTIIGGVLAIFPDIRSYIIRIVQNIIDFAFLKFGSGKQRRIQGQVIQFIKSEIGKKYIVNNSNQRLTRKVRASFKELIKNKSLSEIEEDVYYVYLFSLLEKSVSRVWAASISDPLEWTDSDEEKLFLELNIRVSNRRVTVERIFIIRETEVEKFLDIIPIQKQIYQHEKNEFYFTYYAYESDIPQALVRDIANGFLGFDDFVVAKDVFSDGVIRGELETESLARYNRIFTKLRSYTHPLDSNYFKLKMKKDLPIY